MKKTAFSLIELSIVIMVIGILVAGVTQGSALYKKFKISTARSITQSSDVNNIKGLILWTDATAENVFTNTSNSNNIVDGDYIKSWQERNPQQQDQLSFKASTTGTYPKYKESDLNGLPSLLFDGTDDLMSIASNDRTDILNELSIFIVYSAGTNSYSATASQGLLSKTNGNDIYNGTTIGNNPFVIELVSGNQIQGTLSTSSSISYQGARPTNLMPSINIASFVYNSSVNNISLYINGNTPIKKAVTGRIAVIKSDLVIGRQKSATERFFTGYISEIIMFNRSLNNEERKAVQNYLGKKWGIYVYQY